MALSKTLTVTFDECKSNDSDDDEFGEIFNQKESADNSFFLDNEIPTEADELQDLRSLLTQKYPTSPLVVKSIPSSSDVKRPIKATKTVRRYIQEDGTECIEIRYKTIRI
jgi:hypothetical protein